MFCGHTPTRWRGGIGFIRMGIACWWSRNDGKCRLGRLSRCEWRRLYEFLDACGRFTAECKEESQAETTAPGSRKAKWKSPMVRSSKAGKNRDPTDKFLPGGLDASQPYER